MTLVNCCSEASVVAQTSPEYFLSSYLSPPPPEAVFSLRHDQAVALWRCDCDAVELVRVWELERLSGQKHHYWPHYWPLFSADRAHRFVADLLASEGLSWDDIAESWGLRAFHAPLTSLCRRARRITRSTADPRPFSTRYRE